MENFYSRGVFAGFRWPWDHTLAYSPVPLLYVLLAAVVAWGIERIFRRVRGRKASLYRPTSLPEKIGRGALLAGNRLGIQEAAEAVYGQYLKSPGVEEEIKSYDRFVALVVAAQKAAIKRSSKMASESGCSLDLRLELVNLVGRAEVGKTNSIDSRREGHNPKRSKRERFSRPQTNFPPW